MTRPAIYDRFPDHTLEIDPEPVSVRVTWRGREIARTDAARVLREAKYPPVTYVPIGDVDPSVLSATPHTTHCPFKGDASYYSLTDGDASDENAVWFYPDPFDPVAAIGNHVAFYADRVTLEEVV